MKICSSHSRDLFKMIFRYSLPSASSYPLNPLRTLSSQQIRHHTFKILPPLHVPPISASTEKVNEKPKRNQNPPGYLRDCLHSILQSPHPEGRIRLYLRRYLERHNDHLTFPDLIDFLNITCQSHIRITQPLLLQWGELFHSLPGEVTKEIVIELLKFFQTFSHLNTQKEQFVRKTCDRIVTCKRDELGIFDGDTIGLWIRTIRHLQRRGYDPVDLTKKLSLQLQFTLDCYQQQRQQPQGAEQQDVVITEPSPSPSLSPIDFTSIARAFNSSEDLLKQKKVPFIGDLARLLPFYDFSHLTASDIARFIPHLYLCYDEQTSLYVRLFLTSLLPPLLNSTQTTTPVRLSPTEVTDILTSMKNTNWLSALEYDMLEFLAREMNFEVSTTPTYPLRTLCYSLHGLCGQYLDSPGIESLLSSIAAQFRKYLSFNTHSQQLEVTDPTSHIMRSYDLGAAFYGLNKMPDTSPSLLYLIRTMTPFLRACAEQQQHVTLKTLSSCLVGISRMKSDSEEVSTVINLLADCLETHKEPLNPITVAHFISSLQKKSLASESVERLWKILLAKLEHTSSSLEFTPEQVLHMIIGSRPLDPLHPITKSIQKHLILWIQQLDTPSPSNPSPTLSSASSSSTSSSITPERFAQLLSLMGSITPAGDVMSLWLQYLRNQMRPSDSTPFQLQSSSQVVQCIDGLSRMKSEHRVVRKFLRDLSLVIYQSRDVVLTENDLTKCYVTLQWMNKDYAEVQRLLQVLNHLRSAGKQREREKVRVSTH